jgi:hypothetical protein
MFSQPLCFILERPPKKLSQGLLEHQELSRNRAKNRNFLELQVQWLYNSGTTSKKCLKSHINKGMEKQSPKFSR